MTTELKVQILKDHSTPESRTFEAKDGKPERISWSQTAYMHNGGAFPEKFKLSLPSQDAALPVGDYVLLVSAFKTDKYDGLELDRFNLFEHIAPVKK